MPKLSLSCSSAAPASSCASLLYLNYCNYYVCNLSGDLLTAIRMDINFTLNVNVMLYSIVMRPETDSLPASRARLAAVLRATKDVVSVAVASQVLKLDRNRTAQVLSRWCEQGWLRRIGRGLYVPV